MTALSSDLRDALAKVGTSTLTGRAEPPGPAQHDALRRVAAPARAAPHGGHRLHHAIHPLARGQGRPTSTNRSTVQPQAMEECPPGHVLMIDSRGDSRAASARRPLCRPPEGARRGGHRHRRRLPRHRRRVQDRPAAYHRRPSSPPSPIAHRPVDLNLPIACGGVAGLSRRHSWLGIATPSW